MFSLFDKATPDTARRLWDRGREFDQRYVRLPMPEMARQISHDFPPNMRFVSNREISACFGDLPEFSFTVLMVLDKPLLSIFGGQQYSGFMLQRSSDAEDWLTSLRKPISRPFGRRAKRLAEELERQFGIRNIEKRLARIRHTYAG